MIFVCIYSINLKIVCSVKHHHVISIFLALNLRIYGQEKENVPVVDYYYRCQCRYLHHDIRRKTMENYKNHRQRTATNRYFTASKVEESAQQVPTQTLSCRRTRITRSMRITYPRPYCTVCRWGRFLDHESSSIEARTSTFLSSNKNKPKKKTWWTCNRVGLLL